MSNINAGSDTTAIALRAILCMLSSQVACNLKILIQSLLDYLLQTPRAMTKLQAELAMAHLSNLPKWRENLGLPYLGVVVKEAMRLHTPAGLVVERIVPEGGVTFCGKFIP